MWAEQVYKEGVYRNLALETFAERLKAWREQADLTQVELAKALGVVQQTISDYEAGRSRPGVKRARAIADALSLSQDDVLRALAEAPDDEAAPAAGGGFPDDLSDDERAQVDALIDFLRARRQGK